MKPSRLLSLMVAAAVLAMAALAWWRGGEEVPPQASPVLRPVPVAEARPGEPSPVPAAVAAPASRPPAPVSAALVHRTPLDASSFQRDIQQALANPQRGKAGAAARHIETCQGLDRLGAGMRSYLDARQRQTPSADYVEALAQIAEGQAACQAVDAASRAQLVPLLRRSLAEGEAGAAASLVVALGRGFKADAEPEVMAALTRDAAACDLTAEGVWNRLTGTGSPVVTQDELALLRMLQRRQPVWSWLPAESLAAKAAFELLKKRLGVEPVTASVADVAYLIADVRPHCQAEPRP